MINYSINSAIDSKEVYQNIIDNKVKQDSIDCLEECKSNVYEDYDAYLDNKTTLEKVNPDMRILPKHKTELINVYESKPAALQRALDKLTAKMPLGLSGKCVYCLLSEANTFDHYLNKDRYPEYSIFVPNLLPVCTWCNSYKCATPAIDSKGVHHFIHNVFDILPTVPYLFYDIEVRNHALIVKKIRLDFSLDPTNKLNEVIKRQYRKLHLIERLEKQFPDDIAAILIDFEDEELDEAEVKRILKRKLDKYEKKFGANYWITSIYRGLLNNSAVIAFLCG